MVTTTTWNSLVGRRTTGVVADCCRAVRVVGWVASLWMVVGGTAALPSDPDTQRWRYRAELLRPFWVGEVVERESVLFVRDEGGQEARAAVLFPIVQVLSVHNSAGDVTYEEGRDYVFEPGSREIVLPAGSRIVATVPADLRRPAGTQKYSLTHRDGNGEIFFGGRLEYAAMQTCITYRHERGKWKSAFPRFDPEQLPRSVARLKAGQPLSIVTLGDSISEGANASGMYDEAPFQPAYPELVRRGLAKRCGGEVRMTNLSVGGMDSAWGLTQIDKVLAAKPDLVIVAFGMNDSAGRPAASYKDNIAGVIAAVREKLPECEFILVATMLGNPDWTRLKQELFGEYRQALLELAGPGVAVADLTTIWEGFLERKRDWDQTGNGVNHPNDFGHRVYAQVITTLLTNTP